MPGFSCKSLKNLQENPGLENELIRSLTLRILRLIVGTPCTGLNKNHKHLLKKEALSVCIPTFVNVASFL